MKLYHYVGFWLLVIVISVKFYTYIQNKILAGGFQSTDYFSIVLIPSIFVSATGLLAYKLVMNRRLY